MVLIKVPSKDAPVGRPFLAFSYLSVLIVVFLVPAAFVVRVAAVLCFLTTFLAVSQKVKLQPWSVFLLAVASVILNTYAVGYGLAFKYAVVASPTIAMVQAFASLPFQVISE